MIRRFLRDRFREEGEVKSELGNKKSVDIVVDCGGKTLTIDVKGQRGKAGFDIGNYRKEKNHYLVFVCYLNKFEDEKIVPEVYIVPSKDIKSKKLEVSYKDRIQVQYRTLAALREKYLDKWEVFCK